MVVECRGEGGSLLNKYSHKAMCQNNTEDNKRRYRNVKNTAKKAVLKALC